MIQRKKLLQNLNLQKSIVESVKQKEKLKIPNKLL